MEYFSDLNTEFNSSYKPVYVDSLDGIDLSMLERTLDGFVAKNVLCSENAARGDNIFVLFDLWCISGNETKLTAERCPNEVYFAVLKPSVKTRNEINFYNRLSYIYKLIYQSCDSSGEYYIRINAYNIAQYADGGIVWSGDNGEIYSFATEVSRNMMNIISSLALSKSLYSVRKL